MMILRYQLTKLSLAFRLAKKVTQQLNECDKSPPVSRCVVFLMGGSEQKITTKTQNAPKAAQPTFGA
ncbi:hypothetical protein [Plesiomonas shigelloides]|uniref:hypothetical protein n=1 Tax=Plesiomonas shigelloides TaxID=703 RepID=UPI001262710F|nr:hypothetical protein [Plesiomonas shigelloides]KAB7655922.1 hypothetical protein GBN14_09615 [Plesiomonas shigelloides]